MGAAPAQFAPMELRPLSLWSGPCSGQSMRSQPSGRYCGKRRPQPHPGPRKATGGCCRVNRLAYQFGAAFTRTRWASGHSSQTSLQGRRPNRTHHRAAGGSCQCHGVTLSAADRSQQPAADRKQVILAGCLRSVAPVGDGSGTSCPLQPGTQPPFSPPVFPAALPLYDRGYARKRFPAAQLLVALSLVCSDLVEGR